MKTSHSLFTSESVCSGHPDKICDRISDSVLDTALKSDPKARVAVETLVTKNRIVLAGEVTCAHRMDYEKVARGVVRHLGYTDPLIDFTDESPIDVYIQSQSAEIAAGVDREGAGDQGMMFGYAVNETPELMPLPIMLAHKLCMRIDTVREKKILPYLRPDGKAQVTIKYENGIPKEVEHVVVAVPHRDSVAYRQVKDDVYRTVVCPVLEEYGMEVSDKDFVLNGTGVWHYSGPAADSGVTGRKIIVDTYGGMARVGGGAFSGKDPTKVDRSGAYAARYLAKNIVAAKLATRAEVRLAYFIGAKKPVMQEVETYGTATKSDKVIADFMTSLLDTSVRGIIEGLNLRRPIYAATSSYGHFGRIEFPWEKIV